MNDQTAYEMLTKEEQRLLNDIQALKDLYQKRLAVLKGNLKDVRIALLKYERMQVVHISDSLKKA